MPMFQYTPVSNGNFTAVDGTIFLKPSSKHSSPHPGIVLFATSFNLLETQIDDVHDPTALDERSLLGAIALTDDPSRKKRLNDFLHDLLYDMPMNSSTQPLYDSFKPSNLARLHPTQYLLFDNPRKQITRMFHSAREHITQAYTKPPQYGLNHIESLLTLYSKHLSFISPELCELKRPNPTIFL